MDSDDDEIIAGFADDITPQPPTQTPPRQDTPRSNSRPKSAVSFRDPNKEEPPKEVREARPKSVPSSSFKRMSRIVTPSYRASSVPATPIDQKSSLDFIPVWIPKQVDSEPELATQMEIPQVFDQEPGEYLEENIFPSLLPVIEKMCKMLKQGEPIPDPISYIAVVHGLISAADSWIATAGAANTKKTGNFEKVFVFGKRDQATIIIIHAKVYELKQEIRGWSRVHPHEIQSQRVVLSSETAKRRKRHRLSILQIKRSVLALEHT